MGAGRRATALLARRTGDVAAHPMTGRRRSGGSTRAARLMRSASLMRPASAMHAAPFVRTADATPNAARHERRSSRSFTASAIVIGAVAGGAAATAVALALIFNRVLARRREDAAPTALPGAREEELMTHLRPVEPRFEASDADLAENVPLDEDETTVALAGNGVGQEEGSEADLLDQQVVEPLDEDEWR